MASAARIAHVWLLVRHFCSAEFRPGFGTCLRHTTLKQRRTPHSKALLYCHSLATGVHIAVTQSTTECYVEDYLEF